MDELDSSGLNAVTSQLLLSHTFDVVLLVDEKDLIQYINPAFEEISQYTTDEIIGKYQKTFIANHQSDGYFKRIYQQVANGKKLHKTLVYQKKNGDLFYINTRILPLSQSDSKRGFLLIGKDITTYIYQAAATDMLRNELAFLEREFDTILYNISHNLRAPVATIKGLVELSKLKNSGLPVEDYYRLVEENVDRLDLILADIIRLSLVKNSELLAKEIDFEVLIGSILKSLSKFYPVHSFTISVKVADDLPPVYYEELLLKNILRPILENAIRFRKPTKLGENHLHHIDISVNDTPQEVIVSVSDNGIGIDEAVQHRIFDVFYKGTDRSRGNGLGLFIVKTAVLRLNGQITLTSKKHEGTTVTVKLPKS